MDEMADAHARDSAAERRMREAERMIEAVLAEPVRLAVDDQHVLERAVWVLRRRADHIVAVWN